ncbi:MAG: DUF669 domain-containing protein [Phycisphaerales bacterium]
MPSLNGFNANDVDPNVGFEPIPAGKYLAVIVDSKTKQTKNGAGEYLQLEFEIVDGPYKGRRVWERLTLKHPNEQTVKIARGNLSAICRAVGVMKPNDSVELHNVPLSIVVGLKKREDNGEMTNVVKAFEKRESAATARPSAVAGSAPPWKR